MTESSLMPMRGRQTAEEILEPSPLSKLRKRIFRNYSFMIGAAIIGIILAAAIFAHWHQAWFGFMLGGSIIIETIFNIKGIGWLSYDALLRNDLPVVQASALIFAGTYVVLNLIADILAIIANPRLRHPR